jgi:hypothetical protein
MFPEPWFTLFLFLLAPILIIGAAFVQDRLSDRAAERWRARDAAAQAAE